MSLTDDEVREHREASARPTGQRGLRGPIAHFTDEEIRRIKDVFSMYSLAVDDENLLDFSINSKIEAVLNSDPVFKEPFS
jgi:hypothetical protein